MLNRKVLLIAMLAVLAGMATLFVPREHAAPTQPAATQPVAKVVPAERDKAQAMNALMSLPELKAWSIELEKASGGKVRGALIEYDPAPKVINGTSYWQFSFVENGSDAAHRWESFLVATHSDEILVEDFETDQPLTLEQWRKEKRPLERRSAQD